MPPKDVKKKSMRYNNCVKLSVSFLLKFLSSSLSSLWAWYICPRYVRVPMTSGSIWWTDLKFSITPDRCHVSLGVFEMLTFLTFEGYYSFFLKYFKSVLFALNLLKVSSVFGRRPFPKRHIR